MYVPLLMVGLFMHAMSFALITVTSRSWGVTVDARVLLLDLVGNCLRANQHLIVLLVEDNSGSWASKWSILLFRLSTLKWWFPFHCTFSLF